MIFDYFYIDYILMNIPINRSQSALDVTFDQVKRVLEFPIAVGCDCSWVSFDKLDANQNSIVYSFRSNIKKHSFEDLSKLREFVYDIIKDGKINSPKWFVYNAIAQEMRNLDQNYTDIHNIIKFRNKDDEQEKVATHQMMHGNQNILANTVARIYRMLCSRTENKE
jgi:hypothetical protein